MPSSRCSASITYSHHLEIRQGKDFRDVREISTCRLNREQRFSDKFKWFNEINFEFHMTWLPPTG